MNIKAAYYYQLGDHKKSIIMYYIILMVVYLLLLTTMTFSVSTVQTTTYTGTSGVTAHTTVSGSFGGMEWATIIFVFVAGCNAFKETFGMLIQNGVSRKTLFISRCITAVSISVIMATIGKVFLILFKLLTKISDGTLTCSSLYEQLYLKEAVGFGSFRLHAVSYIFDIFMYLCFMTLGYVISLVYYRLNKSGKIALSVSIPVGLFLVLPIVDSTFTDGKISKAIFKFFDFAFGVSSGHPVNAMITCFVGFLLLSLCSWLLVKKSTVHE
jgi:hypothetical protein